MQYCLTIELKWHRFASFRAPYPIKHNTYVLKPQESQRHESSLKIFTITSCRSHHRHAVSHLTTVDMSIDTNFSCFLQKQLSKIFNENEMRQRLVQYKSRNLAKEFLCYFYLELESSEDRQNGLLVVFWLCLSTRISMILAQFCTRIVCMCSSALELYTFHEVLQIMKHVSHSAISKFV